jgi:peptide/nickel transport system substrate-binding protein
MKQRPLSRTGRSRATVSAVAVVACVALVAASCKSSDRADTAGAPSPSSPSAAERDAGPPHPGGALTIGLSGETDSFNPFAGTWSVPSYEVANAVFEPLAAVDQVGIAHPYLAESITPNEDFTVWTITLRPNVTFQNGQKLDAAALKKNLDTARTTGLTAQAFTLVQSVDIVSDLAVSVHMGGRWATFPASLAMQAGYMAAPAMLDDPAGANATPIGTGPFMVVSRQRDSYLKTKRNPTYWRTDANGTQLPYLDAIDFSILADASSRTSSMAAGNVDAFDVNTPDLLRQLKEEADRSEVQLITNEGAETDETILALNTTREPFNDIIARQALAYAVDQEKLSATAYHNTFPGAWGMFEAGSPYYVSKQDAGYPQPDGAKAKQLAQQYADGHGKPLEFSLILPPDPQYLAIAQTFQAQMAELGITVNLQTMEQTVLIRTVVVSGDYQAAGFVLRSSPSPDQSYTFLATKANPNGLSLNFTRFDDPAITAAMNDFRAAGDPAVRVDAMKKVQQELASNLPMIFLVHARAALAYMNKVHGLRNTTFPGSDKQAMAPYPETPFYAFAWRDPSD